MERERDTSMVQLKTAGVPRSESLSDARLATGSLMVRTPKDPLLARQLAQASHPAPCPQPTMICGTTHAERWPQRTASTEAPRGPPERPAAHCKPRHRLPTSSLPHVGELSRRQLERERDRPRKPSAGGPTWRDGEVGEPRRNVHERRAACRHAGRCEAPHNASLSADTTSGGMRRPSSSLCLARSMQSACARK